MCDAGQRCFLSVSLISAVERKNSGGLVITTPDGYGFSDSEESAVGLTDVVPFLVEDELKQLGEKRCLCSNLASADQPTSPVT
jgi:hypothetical protein